MYRMLTLLLKIKASLLKNCNFKAALIVQQEPNLNSVVSGLSILFCEVQGFHPCVAGLFQERTSKRETAVNI